LFKTQSFLDIKDGNLIGNGGKFSWETVGVPEIFVNLDNYSMAIRNPKLLADVATLNYPQNYRIL